MEHDMTPAATIRAMTQHDLDAVVAIDAALEGQPRRAYFQRRLSAALRDPRLHVQLAAADADGLVGYVLARRTEGEFGRPFPGLRLEAIGVRAAQLGHGVGKALIDALLHYAQQHGVAELRTAARWSDHALLHWLDAVGFLLAPNQVVECAVDEGYRAERGDALELPEGLGTSREIDYGAPGGNDFDRVATLHCEVRPMASADLLQIVRIDRELTGRNREAYIASKLDEAMGESGVRVSLSARLDDTVVGYLMARADFGDFGRARPVAVLDTIGVDPAHAHRGVGHALVAQLFANLGALHVERVETVVELTTQLALLGFLLSTGFTPSQRLAFVRHVQ
ncbi:MAG: GNAT family N-acetyltransferase [Burkholderiaceae bacterium]